MSKESGFFNVAFWLFVAISGAIALVTCGLLLVELIFPHAPDTLIGIV